MKANKYDLVLRMYVGNDNLREAMMKVNLKDGFLEATNAHIAIRMPAELAGLEYKAVVNYPNFVNVYPKEIVEEKMVKIDDLVSLMETGRYEFETKSENCDECQGDGYVECKCCGNEADCEQCDGTGKEQVELPYAILRYNGQNVFVDGVLFDSRYLHTVYMTALLFGVSEVKLKFQKDKKRKGCLIEIGSAEILMMPKMQD